MITCKEFKEVLYEVCFASVKFAAKINNIAENVEAPEVVNFKKEARPSMASQHISYDDDVFYLTNGIGYLADLERRSPIPLASIKRVMIPHKIYNEIISVDSEPQLGKGGNGPYWGKKVDKEKFKKFPDMKVYYVDASKGRVGPELVVQDEDRYEFRSLDSRWYSVSTGMEAAGSCGLKVLSYDLQVKSSLENLFCLILFGYNLLKRLSKIL
ncbi:hypothetical protein ONS96_009891 [Cadophora gregata f. sp. sojae]|nr:hypothetical protein ONS96_009891 [Cadophora gregata f. sp. sojae]